MSNTANLETWTVEALKALLREKHLEEIESIHKQLATKLETYNKLEEENKDLKQENSLLRDLIQDKMPVGCIAETTYQPIIADNENLVNCIQENHERIKGLKERIAKTEEETEDALASLNFYQEANKELKVELKKLRTMEKDIMEEEHAGILGCNPYERFSNVLEELDYDEKWIRELKQEIKELREKVKE